jgi:arginyl-tRNA--protein-N-Asp/Glu arginylyltransferase
MPYFHWHQKTISDFSEDNISKMYADGYVFTRIGKGVMQQTRSVRIDLSKFVMSSENRRILKKVGALENEDLSTSFTITPIALPMKDYDISLGKLAKDFYQTKFGEGIMSAQKIKEMLTDPAKSNFNMLLTYSGRGFSICYSNDEILHYSYPFYDLSKAPKDMGLAMMITAVKYAKEKGLKYIYLGSLQRPTDTYKLQFSGMQWFDGKTWQDDLDAVKRILKDANI